MPVVKHMMESMVKQYGPEKGKQVYYAWEKEHPEEMKKAQATARKHGSLKGDEMHRMPGGWMMKGKVHGLATKVRPRS